MELGGVPAALMEAPFDVGAVRVQNASDGRALLALGESSGGEPRRHGAAAESGGSRDRLLGHPAPAEAYDLFVAPKPSLAAVCLCPLGPGRRPGRRLGALLGRRRWRRRRR